MHALEKRGHTSGRLQRADEGEAPRREFHGAIPTNAKPTGRVGRTFRVLVEGGCDPSSFCPEAIALLSWKGGSMKALDTSALIAIFEGGSPGRALLRRLKGIEVVTSELNLLELVMISAQTGERGRPRRLAQIDRLRRKLTVLPIDAAGIREATSRVSAQGGGSLNPVAVATLGAFEAAGCDELFTLDRSQTHGKWRFKVTKVVSGLRR